MLKNMCNEILLQRRCINAVVPHITYCNDAGHDLIYIGKTVIIFPQQAKNLDTGWNIKIPSGYWGSIKSRSSVFYKRKLLILEGVIDENYTGQLSIVVMNFSLMPKLIKMGDRLAQLLLIKTEERTFKIISQMPITERNDKGFGSSGL